MADEKKWLVKCGECSATIRTTDSRQESNEGGTCEECKEKIRAWGKKTGNRTMWDSKNEVPEDEKEGLKKSMEEPAKLKHSIEVAVQNGMVSSAMMQKLVTKDGYPKPITIKYIMPGLVEYEYMNNGNGARVLVQKNALDKMLADPEKSIIGKPVINEAHRDVSPDDYQNGKADGIVTDAWYEPADGWYYCTALIWDEDTRKNIQNGHSVSCEYTALPPWGPAGTLNQVAYDKEVTDGRYKHLAVVSGPRYEGAKIMNSIGGRKTMKLLQWLKKGNEEVKNSVEVDAENTVIVGEDGVHYPLAKAAEALKNQIAAEAKVKADADAAALKNAKVLGDADTITIDGKAFTGLDLKNAMAAKVKNDADEKSEKDHKEGEHDDKKADNCKMCNGDMVKGDCPSCDGSGEKGGKNCPKCEGSGIWYTAKNSSEEDEKKEKEKKDEDAKNSVLMNSQHRLGQHIVPNEKCDICDGIQADRLSNAARMRRGELPSPAAVPSIHDGLRKGKEMFGKTQAQQDAAAAK